MTAIPDTPPSRLTRFLPWLFTLAVFYSASLVFVVQPLVGKLLLPTLGGSAAVWNTSLAFFQGALLVGYGYAHLLQKLPTMRLQMAVHFVALAVAALVLPLQVSQVLGSASATSPALWLLGVLTLTIGAPFAVLSATAPLLQAWFARTGLAPAGGRDVYGLYAASNIGSLLALLAYPLLIEPLSGLSAQARAWSVGYGGFVLVLAAVAIASWRWSGRAADPHVLEQGAPPTPWRERLIWVLLAAAPSSLLVGVTSHISADVASAPFLWVVPLALYLVTFIVAFASGRPPGLIVLLAHLVAVPAALMMIGASSWWHIMLLLHLAAFFTTALICHQTLVSRRPPPERLTEFYLAMSVGGVLGGAFNAFAAPVLFNGVWEYPAVLALAVLARPSERTGSFDIREKVWLGVGILWLIPLCIPGLVVPDIVRIALMASTGIAAIMIRQRTVAVFALYVMLALGCCVQAFGHYNANFRSFFGVIHLREAKAPDMGPFRMMVHGTTVHGVQLLDPGRACQPTTYYAKPTIVGQVFQGETARRPALAIGAVGLGAGTVSAYVRPTDTLRFYEIDPMVVKVASDPRYFTFLNGCAKGPVDVVLGDARLRLNDEPDGRFDLLLVDAFSSDSVPIHLLTVEAIRGYLRVTKPDGVIVLHLSNRNLDLVPVASAGAKAAGADLRLGLHATAKGATDYADAAQVALVISRSPQALARYDGRSEWRRVTPGPKAWTDDRSNILGPLIDKYRTGAN